ncbi:MAG: ATP-binding protein [Desulfobacterales bacterium]|nr:ATP-binding protein [Desulfobacterales bacterium]
MRTEKEKKYMLKAVDALQREIVVVSPGFEILAANRFSRERRGMNMVGQPCYQVFFNHNAPCDDCPGIPAFTCEKNPFQRKLQQNLNTDRASCYPIRGENGIEAMVMMDFDLHRLDKLEEEVQRSNAFLKNLILSAVDSVIAADKTGRILIFNEAAAEILGYNIETALNEINIRDMYPGDGARDVMRKLRSQDHGGKGKLKSYLVNLLGQNGQTIPISLNAAIIYEGDKEVATIGFFHDMRDELSIKKELERTQVQLLQAEKMASLGKLAAGVAHQLNNPLGGITLFTKLVLEEHDLPESAKEDLTRILKDAERCRDTVKELLEFTRQTKHMMRPHDINRALLRTLFLLENQTLFQNITIEKQLAEDLPQLMGDIQQLNHLFMNIILNAAQAMEGKGALTLKTTLLPDGEFICIEITDTGPGIPDDILAHIFEPFFTTKEEGKGTGLGLSLVYGIVENHGGRIHAKSKLGVGTSFIIELPVSGPTEKGVENGQSTG